MLEYGWSVALDHIETAGVASTVAVDIQHFVDVHRVVEIHESEASLAEAHGHLALLE